MKNLRKERYTQKEKNAHNKAWYRQKLDYFDNRSFTSADSSNGLVETFTGTFSGYSNDPFRRKKVNYDLYNGIIDNRDFKHVCKPYGDSVGKMPADFTNKDIVSPRIKALLGLEMKRPFSFKVFATNPDSTTRKEEEEFSRIREFVVSEIMRPIQQRAKMQTQQEIEGRELTAEEQQQIQQQVAEKIQAQTPDRVRQFMNRKYQDPAEAMAHQLLQYLFEKQDIKRKFNKGFKNACLVAEEIYWVGEIGKEPALKVVNPSYFDFDASPDFDFIEDGEWAVYEFWLTPSQVVNYFGDDLSNEEIDRIYTSSAYEGSLRGDAFNFDLNSTYNTHESGLVRVLHVNFKALRKIGFLTTVDGNEKIIVDENYQLNVAQGDVDIEWRWIAEAHEGYKIGTDIYPDSYMRPVPGQFKDLDNLYECKLSYYGAAYEKDNSTPTSPMDRMKPYQYYLNIILYRIELLMASDKGKLLLLNMDAMAKSQNIDMKKWLYYADVLKIGFMNNSEEGKRSNVDVSTAAKQVDMSLASDITRYINLAEYIEKKCADSVGISDEMLGQIMASQRVSNTQQSLAQSSTILEPYFEMHNAIKKNVLTALLEQARVTYSEHKPKKLVYILDDLSQQIINLDPELLDLSTYGIFVSDTANLHEAKENLKQLAHAALQSQTADFSDILKVLRSPGLQEAEELLETAENRKREEISKQQMQQIEAQAKENEKQHAREMEKLAFERETKLLETELKGEIDTTQQVILAAGFNEDKDLDNDGKLDVAELAQNLASVEVEKQKVSQKDRDQSLEERKFEHQKEIDKEKLKIEKMKAKGKSKS